MLQIHMMDLPVVELESLKKAENKEEEPEFNEEDLPKIEKEMKKISKSDKLIKRIELTKEGSITLPSFCS